MFLRNLLVVVLIQAALATACMGEELGNKMSYMVLPKLTNEQRMGLALKAWRNPEKYFSANERKIHAFSAKLEKYIRQWLAGDVAAEFPKGFLPQYINSAKTHDWKLVPPDKITAEEQWYVLPAYDPQKKLCQFSPDPHATYLKLIFLAPLGSRLIIEGEFPHARFMDYQILTPVDTEHPVTGQMGICEVPIVDVDIEPLPGHVNPFMEGANRTAKKRSYRVVFELATGNASTLNPEAMRAPAYRAEGNTRVGGPFAFAGPWGGNVLVPSVVWLRYYAADKGAGPLGGVPMPKATLQLATGEKFWLTCDKSRAVELQTTPVAQTVIPPQEPYRFIGPSLGWFKMYGIMMVHAEARAYYKCKPWGKEDPTAARQRIRRVFHLLFHYGANASAPGNVAHAATECNYISYLVRSTSLGRGKALVLTGKLPTFPQTRDGEKIMSAAEVRYFSITHQLGANQKRGKHGTPYGSLMDDEIIVNEKNEYVIVYSRKEDRPKNAYARFGVTWQEWGAPSTQTFVVRWMSVMPEWYLPAFAPDELNLPRAQGSWSQDGYDQSLVGKNYPGMMEAYHPVIHYLTRARFEQLGENKIRGNQIPQWKLLFGER